MEFSPQDPNYEQRTRESFAKQEVMQTLGASIAKVAPGEVEISLPFNQKFTQQHGFLHAGVVATILDSACGYAAFSLMPSDCGVLTIEYKINLLAPASGKEFAAIAHVKRPGRTITVCSGDVIELENRKQIASMQATIMTIRGRTEISD